MLDVNPNILNKVLAQFADLQFLISGKHSLSFADFFKDAKVMSDSFKIEAQERIALTSENPEYLLKAMLALWLREAVAVPLNPEFPEKQREDLNFKFRFRNFESVYKRDQLGNSNSKSNTNNSKPETKNLINPEAWATVILTSGSSGSPKAVVHSLANHFFNALGANQLMPLKTGDRWLLSLPLYHVGGLAIFFRTLLSGAAMVIPEKKEKLLQTILKQKITHLSLVPTQLQRLLQTQQGIEAAGRLKLILLGGASIPKNLIEQSEQLGLKLKTTYGSTEMASQIYTAKQVLPFREVRISTTDDVAGEIEVRGKTLFLGYLKQGGLQKPFDKQGWFKTGDLGCWKYSLDQQKYLTVIGRSDSMFISGGENIHPEEIERILLQFEHIEQVVVVAVQDLEFGARPVAFLKTKQSLTESELRLVLEKQLPRFKIPDLFLAWPESAERGLKPRRNELSKLAQIKFESWRKLKQSNKTNLVQEFGQWQAKFELGWLKVALSEGRQIFMVLDMRRIAAIKYLYVRADSRKEVMDWLTTPENRSLFEIESGNSKNLSWITMPSVRRGQIRESFEIVRILENDLPESESDLEISLYESNNHSSSQESSKTTFSSPRTQSRRSSNKPDFSNLTPWSLIDLSPLFKSGWSWNFPEAVFQSAVWLPNFERMYLLRCLYRRISTTKKFLGWKVQLLHDLKSGEQIEAPFWELSLEEEKSLEINMRSCGLFSDSEFEYSNTPEKERKRRTEFQQLVSTIN